jgi:hypothetical protein
MNLDITNGIETNSLLKIALVPIGKINSKVFTDIAISVQKFTTITIMHLTRFQKDNQQSKF